MINVGELLDKLEDEGAIDVLSWKYVADVLEEMNITLENTQVVNMAEMNVFPDNVQNFATKK